MRQAFDFSAELVPVAYAEALLQLAEEYGVARDALCVAARVRPEVLASPTGRLSFVDFHLLTLAALECCGEPALGLRWLEDAQTRIPAGMQDEGEYWRLLGDLAQDQRQEALTLKAYRRLLQTPHAGISDYDEVIRLLQRADRREAASNGPPSRLARLANRVMGR